MRPPCRRRPRFDATQGAARRARHGRGPARTDQTCPPAPVALGCGAIGGFGTGKSQMRSLGITTLCVALAGCGLARQQEQKQAYDKAMAQVTADIEVCNQTYPKVQKTALARAQCLGSAVDTVRPHVTYPDLLDQEKTSRNALAEQWQNGKITQMEYEAKFNEMHSQVVAEEQRRNLANRSVGAQESAAAAAWLASPSVVVVPVRR
jgi:hypothetical protein